MIIKNHDILVNRAEEHARLDHLTRQTYGDIYYLQNGEAEVIKWEGCAISCLATETSIEALKNQDDLNFDAVKVSEKEDGRVEFSVILDSDILRGMLTNKFGMCMNLIYMAECVFEGSDEEYAQTWPERFAKALCNGLDIYDEDISDFWVNEVVPELDEIYNHYPDEFFPNNYQDDEGWTWSIDEYFDYCYDRIGDKFLEFIERLKADQFEGKVITA